MAMDVHILTLSVTAKDEGADKFSVRTTFAETLTRDPLYTITTDDVEYDVIADTVSNQADGVGDNLVDF